MRWDQRCQRVCALFETHVPRAAAASSVPRAKLSCRHGAEPGAPWPLLLQSGRRNADRFHGELFAAYVRQPGLSAEDQAKLDKNLQIAREVGATIKVLEDTDPVRALIIFAQEIGITQIFIGHSQQKGWLYQLRANPVERLIDLAEGIDVRVFPQRPGDA